MDNLRSLLEKKEYQLVLDLTKGSDDPEDVFVRLTALVSLNRGKEAMAELLSHRDDLFAKNASMTIKVDMELRFILKQWDEAYDDIRYFENKPYVSQQVEEQLRILPDMVRANERSSNFVRDYDEDTVKNTLLTSEDDYEVLSMLNYIKTKDIDEYLPALHAIVSGKRHPYVRTYALLLLVAIKDNSPVDMEKGGKKYSLVPSQMQAPYTGERYRNFVRKLSALGRDPSVSNVAVELLGNCIMDAYPEEVIGNDDDKATLGACYLLALDYLKSSDNGLLTLKDAGINLDEAILRKHELEELVGSLEPLTY